MLSNRKIYSYSFCKKLLFIAAFIVALPVWGQTDPAAGANPQTQVIFDDSGGVNSPTNFGIRIAVSGSGKVMVVGAPSERSGTNSAVGAAYVYVRADNGNWESAQRLVASERGAYDLFGSGVAIDDSGNTIIVGARQNSITRFDLIGRAYIFTRTIDEWTESTILDTAHPAPINQYYFGSLVAITADGQTVAVGASRGNYAVVEGAEPGITTSMELMSSPGAVGLVEIFNREGERWVHEVFIGATNPQAESGFGGHGVLFGDDDKNGLDMVGNRDTAVLVAAVHNEASMVTGVHRNYRGEAGIRTTGAVYVYRRNGGEWDKDNIFFIKPDSRPFGYAFGSSVALSGDGMVLAVGANGDRSDSIGVHDMKQGLDLASLYNSGAVYLYRFDIEEDIWVRMNYIKASYQGQIDFSVVGLSADGLLLAVGARKDDSILTGVQLDPDYNPGTPSINTNFGAVFVFARNGDSWAQTAVIKPQSYDGSVINHFFGDELAIGGTADSPILAMGADGVVEVIETQDLFSSALTATIEGTSITGTVAADIGDEVMVSVGSDVAVTEDITVAIAVSGGITASVETITLTVGAPTAEFTVTVTEAGAAEVLLTAPAYSPAIISFAVSIGALSITAPPTVMLEENANTTIAVRVNSPPTMALTITAMTEDPDNAITLDNTELIVDAGATNAMLTITATDNDEFNPMPRVATVTLTAEGYRTATVLITVAQDSPVRLTLDVVEEIDLFTGVSEDLIVNIQATGDFVGLTLPTLSFVVDQAGIIEVAPSQVRVLNGSTSVEVTGVGAGNAVLTLTISGNNYETTTEEVQVTVMDRLLRIEGLDVSALNLVAGESEMRSLTVESVGGEVSESEGVAVSVEVGDSDVVEAEATLDGVRISGIGSGMSTVLVTALGEGYATTSVELTVTVEALHLEVEPELVNLTEGGGASSSETVSVRLNRALNEMEMESGATIMVTVEGGDGSGLVVGMVGGGMLSGVNGDEVRIGDDGTVELVVSVEDDLVYTGDRQVMVRMRTIGIDGIVGALELELTVNIAEDEEELSLEVLDEEGNAGIETLTVSEGSSGMFTVRVNRIDTIGGSLSLTITGGEGMAGLTVSPRMIELTRAPAVLSATITVDVAENDIVDEPVTLAIAASGYAEQTLRVRIADNDSSVSFDRERVEIGREVGSTATAEVVLSVVLEEAVTVQIANPTSRLSVNGMRAALVELDIDARSTALPLSIRVEEEATNEEAEEVILTIESAETAGDAVAIGDGSLVVTIAAGIIQFMLKVFLEGAQ